MTGPDPGSGSGGPGEKEYFTLCNGIESSGYQNDEWSFLRLQRRLVYAADASDEYGKHDPRSRNYSTGKKRKKKNC
jgi:hypothetical protein